MRKNTQTEWITSYFGMGDGTSQEFNDLQDEDGEVIAQVIQDLTGGWYVMLNEHGEIAQVSTLAEGKELVEKLIG